MIKIDARKYQLVSRDSGLWVFTRLNPGDTKVELLTLGRAKVVDSTTKACYLFDDDGSVKPTNHTQKLGLESDLIQQMRDKVCTTS